MLALRDYQSDLLKAISDALTQHRRLVVSMPTGAGKTVVAAALAKEAIAQGKSVWFLVDRIVLADQTLAAFEAFGLECGVVQGSRRELGRDVTIASSQTLARMSALPEDAFVIIDECHCLFEVHKALLCKNTVVGLSATPERHGLADYYDALVTVPTATLGALTNAGYVMEPRVLVPVSPDRAKLKTRMGDYTDASASKAMAEVRADVVMAYGVYGNRRPALLFAPTVEDAHGYAEMFNASGFPAAVSVGSTKAEEHERYVEQLRTGELLVLCSVSKLNTGLDVPEASVAILARPTKSKTTYIQSVGRVLRVADGKDKPIVLDCAGVVAELGLPCEYAPTALKAEREWSAFEDIPYDKGLISCPDCHSVMLAGQRKCSECGHTRTDVGAVLHVGGRMVELTAEGTELMRLRELALQPDYRGSHVLNGLTAIREEKDYSPAWVSRTFSEIEGRHPTAEERALAVAIEHPETSRFVSQKNAAYAKQIRRSYWARR